MPVKGLAKGEETVPSGEVQENSECIWAEVAENRGGERDDLLNLVGVTETYDFMDG